MRQLQGIPARRFCYCVHGFKYGETQNDPLAIVLTD